MINKVGMSNFKNHVESEFEFEPGINAIVGPGGCGKTSIMEVIGWLVFGALPGKKSEVQRWDSGESANAGVEFNSCRIAKSFAPYARLFSLGSKDRLIAEGEMSVRETVAEMFSSKNLDFLFSGLIGITQGSIDNIFARSNSERIKHFSKIIGIDEYKKCADWLVSSSNHLIVSSAAAEGELERLIESIETYDQGRVSLDSLLGELETLDIITLPEATEAWLSAKDILDAAMSITEGNEGALSEIRVIDAKLSKGSAKQALASVAGNFCPECGQLMPEAQSQEMMEKYEQEFDEASKFLERKSHLEYEVELKKHILAGFKELSSLREDANVAKSKLSELNNQAHTLRGKVDAMKDALDSDPSSRLGNANKRVSSLKLATTKLKEVRDVCRKVPAIVSESTTQTVSDLATYFVKMIYENWSIEWDSDFSVSVDKGTMTLPFACLSKSERGIVSLSIILALAKEVSPVDFILLDEPFANMDSSQVVLVSNAIRSTGWFGQVILTTHRAEVEHVFDNVIEVSDAVD